jgi:hypothetical protein
MAIPKGYRPIDIKSLDELDKSKEYKLASQELYYAKGTGFWEATDTTGLTIQADIDAGCPVYEKIPVYREVRTVRAAGGPHVNIPLSIPIGAKVLVIYPVPEGESE